MNLIRFFVACACLLTVGVNLAAEADDYPAKPLRLVVPFAPGGASDNVARQLAVRLAEEMNTSVVVDNRPGAAGNIALEYAAKAPADGYTMMLGNVSTNAINPWIYAAQLKSNPSKDLAAVSMVATIPHVLAASAKFEPNNVGELVSYAKRRPGEVNHASAGAGSYAMIDMLIFEKAAGLKMVHVPFKGGAGQFVVAMVSNEVQIAFTNASSVLELVKAGKLKALAVTTPARLPELPEVQTMQEAGFKGIGTNAWQGVFVPAGTPAPVVKKLHAAIGRALARPELKESYAKMLIVPAPSASPEEFSVFVAAETARWGKTAREFNVTVD